MPNPYYVEKNILTKNINGEERESDISKLPCYGGGGRTNDYAGKRTGVCLRGQNDWCWCYTLYGSVPVSGRGNGGTKEASWSSPQTTSSDDGGR